MGAMNNIFFQKHKNRLAKTGVSLFLVAAILAVYGQTGTHQFINFDDQQYLYDNQQIHSGLTVRNMQWAFTTVITGNWHPLTWLSHMLDFELFGMATGGHHLVSVAMHAANAILLFLLLNRLTGTLWRSAVVAALFALHPLHVESVAWASERKDVLSTLLWMVTLYLYAGYTQKSGPSRYLLMLITYALGLMAKPMLVTLPLIMLLLDYWPLKRFTTPAPNDATSSRNHVPWNLVTEKIPFILLAAASCAITIHAQKSALSTLANTTILSRIFNALAAYQAYLGKTIMPQNLAVFYPYNHALPAGQAIGAAIMLCTVSGIVIRLRQSKPYLFVGWFWYIVTLMPVIGIVQAGMQAMADRYTYIPLAGIFILAIWGVAEATTGWPWQRPVLTILTGATLTACALLAWKQVSYWKNSTTLFTHALAVTHNNYIAHYCLGCESEQQGRTDEAISNYKAALAENPFYGPPYGKLGKIYYAQGRLNEAIDYFYKELFVSPISVNCRNNLGIALADNGRLDEAISHFTLALRLKPDSVQTQENLAHVLEMQKAATAIMHK
jgi:tetratricopeptide (TPR) repeat protein